MRPRRSGSSPRAARINRLKAADIVETGLPRNGSATGLPAYRTDKPSKRWLAIGLAGMVYVMGLAGLWSMYRTFEHMSAAPLTPAHSADPTVPFSEPVDLRDAKLIVASPSATS